MKSHDASRADHPHSRPMQCMEIFGGSSAREELVSTPGLDAWISSAPYEGALDGGDVHYVSLCGGGVITRLILADVSGHGEAVADVAVVLRSLMRKNINSKSQTRLIRALNRQFAELAQLRRFATAIVATYLATNKTLTLCNAGHPRPLLYRDASKTWSLLVGEAGTAGAANLPLGIDDQSSYDQFAVTLAKGDVVVVYTDALTEAQAGEDGPQLGEEGLLEIARGLPTDDPANLGRALLAAISRYRGPRPADDDASVIVLRHTAAGPKRLSVAEKLDVYAKVFRLKSV
jgi:sigma-B regulation protein RsbU (phosphoserine phosphatase)